MPAFSSIRQAAAYAHVAADTVRDWIVTGRLTAESSPIGRNRLGYRIARAELDAAEATFVRCKAQIGAYDQATSHVLHRPGAAPDAPRGRVRPATHSRSGCATIESARTVAAVGAPTDLSLRDGRPADGESTCALVDPVERVSRDTDPIDPAAAIRGVYEAIREPRSPVTAAPSTELVGSQQPSISRVLYRIVQASSPALSDFTSNLAKCLLMRGAEPKEPLLWAGLSMFDTLEAATRNAQRYNGRIGRFLAELDLPRDGDARVLMRQTLRPGHFTVLCCEGDVPLVCQERTADSRVMNLIPGVQSMHGL